MPFLTVQILIIPTIHCAPILMGPPELNLAVAILAVAAPVEIGVTEIQAIPPAVTGAAIVVVVTAAEMEAVAVAAAGADVAVVIKCIR